MDRLRVQQQFEQLQSRYIGVGNPDTTRDEWRTNVARDSYASYIGHPPMLQHFSIALGQPQAVTHAKFIDVSITGGHAPQTPLGRLRRGLGSGLSSASRTNKAIAINIDSYNRFDLFLNQLNPRLKCREKLQTSY
jgi:splicing factor 3B subunit 5